MWTKKIKRFEAHSFLCVCTSFFLPKGEEAAHSHRTSAVW